MWHRQAGNISFPREASHLCYTGRTENIISRLHHPFRLVADISTAIYTKRLVDWNAWQVYVLHRRPDNRQTAGFCRKCINLIGTLPNITKEAFNCIGAANVAMHNRWEGIKRQQMIFLFDQAAYCFGIALLIFGFEGR